MDTRVHTPELHLLLHLAMALSLYCNLEVPECPVGWVVAGPGQGPRGLKAGSTGPGSVSQPRNTRTEVLGGALSGPGMPRSAPVVPRAHPVHSHHLTWTELVPLVTGDGSGPVGIVCN